MKTPSSGIQPVTHTLDNGLTVVVLPRRGAPLGTFWIWYRVGGRNEVPGITGISHWVEHMLFKGTQRFGKGEIFRSVSANGGTLNGFTWIDYTAYFETLPIDRIDLAFQIEADRMVNARFDPDEVERERTVIIAEKQGSENQPTTLLREEVGAAAFRAHPYGQGVIGHLSDLRSITREDLYHHYRTFYQPGNAVAVFVGDLAADDALARIEAAFGDIPAGASVGAVRTVEPPRYGERRVSVYRPAPHRVVQVAYGAPAASHPDAPAMVVIDALLSGGKSLGFGGGASMGRSSRLYRRMVASGMVAAAGSSFSLTIDPYLFGLSATLKPDSDPQLVEETLHAEVARLAREPIPAAEFARAHKQIRAQFAYAAESIAGVASLLGAQSIVAPDTDVETFMEQVEAVSVDDIMRVAGLWLTERNRTVGWLIPEGSTNDDGHPVATALATAPAFYTPDPDDRALDQSLPAVQETVLDNGLRVVTLEPNPVAASRALSVRLRIPGGSAVEGEQRGLAAFCAAMLTRGSAGRALDAIAEELDGLGASLGAGAAREAVDVTAKSLLEDAETILARMADAILRPDFPPDQLEIVRGQTLTGIRQARQDTRAEAERLLREMLYPIGHPYRERVSGDEDSVGAITREHLIAHHARALRPGGAIVAVAGGMDHANAVELVGRHFNAWQGTSPELAIPAVMPADLPRRVDAGLPGKTQADIAAGALAISRSDPDYHALNTANLIMGRLGLMGRLGESIRERQGMAYYAYSALEAGHGVGMWSVRAGVDPANVEKAIDSLYAELRRFLANGPTEQEMRDAIGHLTGALPLGLETSDNVARVATDIVFYSLGSDYLRRYREMIRGLTPEALRAAMARHIDPERLAVAVVGPASE